MLTHIKVLFSLLFERQTMTHYKAIGSDMCVAQSKARPVLNVHGTLSVRWRFRCKFPFQWKLFICVAVINM